MDLDKKKKDITDTFKELISVSSIEFKVPVGPWRRYVLYGVTF